ncbi:MAG TPA: outer membrane beta-barrel protein [Acidobacteriaceae bacterium]|nr:outer membrane beta-barrel protein [Acidobacteriaceae bacterium]
MYLNSQRLLWLMAISLPVAAQTQSTPPPAPAPAAAPAAPANWHFAGVDWTGYVDGYGSLNNNHPTNAANTQSNDLYNFDDRTDQFSLAEARITFNRNPSPVGVHADVLFGRANAFLHPDVAKHDDDYLEQAYLSVAPKHAHGTEFDLGQFVTAAGAEVIEAKDNWNYSRSILFAWAIPYYHFGLRTSTPVTKTWTAGFQLVNGWNNTINSEGGPTGAITSTLTKPKYTWSADLYTGPEKSGGIGMYRNLLDTTVLLTPTTKFNAYLNVDYGHNHTDAVGPVPAAGAHWEGVALAAHEQFTTRQAFAARIEFLHDKQGFATGLPQTVKEGTATYEHKFWKSRFLGRAEYRHDWSNENFFHKGDNRLVPAQSTFTLGMMAVLAPGT